MEGATQLCDRGTQAVIPLVERIEFKSIIRDLTKNLWPNSLQSLSNIAGQPNTLTSRILAKKILILLPLKRCLVEHSQHCAQRGRDRRWKDSLFSIKVG